MGRGELILTPRYVTLRVKRALVFVLVFCMAALTVPEQVFGAQDDSQAVAEQGENAEQAQGETELPEADDEQGQDPEVTGEPDPSVTDQPEETEEPDITQEPQVEVTPEVNMEPETTVTPEEGEAVPKEPEDFLTARVKAGWVTEANGELRYRFTDGSYSSPGWEEIGNHWYYFDSRGRLETGWITIKSGTYYLTETGAPGVKGAMLTGWQNIAGNTYYFEESGSVEGKMNTGWQDIS